jgi:hypothetical protein
MSVLWLIVLLIYAICTNPADVPVLAWLLLIPLFLQDTWDMQLRRKLQDHIDDTTDDVR